MNIAISGNVTADEKVRRYVTKVIGSLENKLPRTLRYDTSAYVVLNRVNRAHGNKYEAEVRLHAGSRSLIAKDSTLNVLAALDIVRVKLIAQL